MKMMKPILFNTEMVKAILDGRKTVTRRLVPQKILNKYYDYDDYCISVMPTEILCTRTYEREFLMARSRYQTGDILYVRETWYYETFYRKPGEGTWVYKADNEEYPVCPGKWHPSIHMPKEAARLFLKVTNVRVERVQDITPHEAWKEGCRIGNSFPWEEHIPELQQQCRDIMFKTLWNSTIKDKYYGWDANPWVWVIDFEVLDTKEVHHEF